jgi:hypothetical protein
MVTALGTLPPNLLVATRNNILWAQIPVLYRMPLLSQVRANSG